MGHFEDKLSATSPLSRVLKEVVLPTE